MNNQKKNQIMKNFTMKQFRTTGILLAFLWFATIMGVYASDNPVTLGGGTLPLQVNVYSGGNYAVRLYLNGGYWKQFFRDGTSGLYTPIFAIRLGNTVYSSSQYNDNISGIVRLTNIADVGSPVTSGPNQEVTKRFSGTHAGAPFSVTIKIMYNTALPNQIMLQATVDASQLNATISLAYGFEPYTGTSDRGYAYTVPNYNNLNNSPTVQVRDLSESSVGALQLAAVRNNSITGGLIGFFPVEGRPFNKALAVRGQYPIGYSPNYYYGYPHVQLNYFEGSLAMPNRFEFGDYSNAAVGSGYTNLGVMYKNIPTGTTTVIKTGVLFSPQVIGDLNPVITTNVSPTAPAAKCIDTGNFPALSVVATGAGLAYQWYSNTSNSNSGGSSISGATVSSYAPPSSSAGSRYYYCIVSNAFGSATSNVSGVHTVNNSVAPTITTNVSTTPPTAQCVSSGTFPTLSVVATGAVSYQWYSNISN
jgi:hypothetical protein